MQNFKPAAVSPRNQIAQKNTAAVSISTMG